LTGTCLAENELRQLCEKATDILIEESNVQPVQAPVNVCGDIHGQFYDVLELFKTGGPIPEKNYIFIGDFVDRGYNSVETFQLLICLKLKYPGCITLLRGNHESRMISQQYGFYEEIMKKYGNANVWKYCTDLFDYLPISALIEGTILCVHGGISPSLKTIDQMRTIDRKIEIPHEGPFTDLMWSDPNDNIDTWALNDRGAGYFFGAKVAKQFNHMNGLEIIARAHQLVQEGYNYKFDKNLVTIWSAPNYCYRCGNVASILELDEKLERNWKLFKEAPLSQDTKHPRKLLPYFL